MARISFGAFRRRSTKGELSFLFSIPQAFERNFFILLCRGEGKCGPMEIIQ